MNLKVRIKNKIFWLTMIPAVLLLVQATAAVFGYTLDMAGINDKLLIVVNALFGVLAVLGIANDPTTDGVSDSALAMTYEAPKTDE